MVCKKDKTGKRKTLLDLSLDPISVIPKFRSIVIGKFLQQHHDIVAAEEAARAVFGRLVSPPLGKIEPERVA